MDVSKAREICKDQTTWKSKVSATLLGNRHLPLTRLSSATTSACDSGSGSDSDFGSDKTTSVTSLMCMIRYENQVDPNPTITSPHDPIKTLENDVSETNNSQPSYGIPETLIALSHDAGGFSLGSLSVTSSLGCRMVLNLAARSSRFTRGRAEVSVDRGFRGAARPHSSRFNKNRLPFACSKNDSASAHPTMPGCIVLSSIVFVCRCKRVNMFWRSVARRLSSSFFAKRLTFISHIAYHPNG
ncbi:hypothetical protein EVAR_38716_1 [Eumeta japonica]|uniref:Uncharacterized protein n=1 Tax=Eumeta variegata TaxID=151549 RepID=A0A4C1XPX0_EUMVA|nr:hypothetical protein EVAR_38716_1 [Eumeta japonica]